MVRFTLVFLALLNAAFALEIQDGVHWGVPYVPGRGVTSLAEVNQDIWFLNGTTAPWTWGVSDSGAALYNRFSRVDGSDSLLTPDSYPKRLRTDGASLFIDRDDRYITVGTKRVPVATLALRADGSLALEPRFPGHLIGMGKDWYAVYTGDSILIRYGDRADTLSGGELGAVNWGSHRFNFFFRDRDGGYWYSFRFISDIPDCEGLWHALPGDREPTLVAGADSGRCWEAAAQGPGGELYFATSKALLELDQGKWRDLTPPGLAYPWFTAVAMGADSVLWAGTGGGPGIRADQDHCDIVAFKDGQPLRWQSLSPPCEGGQTCGVTDILLDRNGGVWVAGIHMSVEFYGPWGLGTRRVARSRPESPAAGGFDLLGKRLGRERARGLRAMPRREAAAR